MPSYNLDISRPKAVLTYNGMVLSPGTDYVQEFQVNDGTQNENKPDRIIFTPGSSGNYIGTWTVEVETRGLPTGATLTIRDTNNNYIYQATDLFGYVNYQELTVEETQTRAENKLEMDFSNYSVQIATVAEYYAAGGGDTALENAAGRVLDVDAYIVKMTRLDNPDLYGYFFMRVVPRSVVVKGVYNEKVYGELPPTRFDYTTNLRTLVGSGANREESEPHGDIDEPSGFFKHDVEQGYPTGSLFRAEGEDVGNYYYALNTLTAGPNYTLTVSSDTMFTIHPKSLAKLDDLGRVVDPVRAADDITVNCPGAGGVHRLPCDAAGKRGLRFPAVWDGAAPRERRLHPDLLPEPELRHGEGGEGLVGHVRGSHCRGRVQGGRHRHRQLYQRGGAGVCRGGRRQAAGGGAGQHGSHL